MRIHNKDPLELLNPERDLDWIVVAVVAEVESVVSQSVCEDEIQYIRSTYRHYTNNRPDLYNGRDP